MGKQKILVSACLLGVPCRYDGKSREEAGVLALLREWVLIPICPEQSSVWEHPFPTRPLLVSLSG